MEKVEKSQKPYYVAQFDENGQIEYYERTKQFVVEIDTEVRFLLKQGTKFSKQAKLLVNKPKILEDDTKEYTMTQPRKQISEQGPKDQINEDEDELEETIDTRYLEKIDPVEGDENFNLEFRVHFTEAGSFFIQLEYFDEEYQKLNYTKHQYINVEPVIVLQGDKISCKQLSIMTVLSRSLGKLDRWEEVLSNISQLGYNAIHFTPIQEYGESYSHYSLRDQTTIADYYFGVEAQEYDSRERLKALKDKLFYIREEYGLITIVDIVLNHTAKDSHWLLEHPEAAYNTDDCPHLVSAFILDEAIDNFSRDFSQCKNMKHCPSAPYIKTEVDLQNVINALANKVIPPLKLHEYFLCNIDYVIKKLKDFFDEYEEDEESDDLEKKFKRKQWFNKDKFQLLCDKLTINRGGPERYGIDLKMPDAAVYFYITNNKNKENAITEISNLLKRQNIEWKVKVDQYIQEALEAIRGNIRYHKIECKKFHIKPENPIVDRYFSELDNLQKSKVAYNGWIMNHDPMIDFAMHDFHYLRRTINVWCDSVKLRYGKSPSDSPYLWQRMSQYVSDMASIFDGFRLDNAHSTPLHVCQYMLQYGRTQNLNLFVMAELFTQSAEIDAMFVQKLNINGLIREIQNRNNGKSLGDYFHYLTCTESILGLVDTDFEDIKGNPYYILKAKKPNDIIYDQTHDNPSPLQKFQTGRIALSHLGLISLADQAIASTWGYDYLLPNQLNVVTENRLYIVDDQSYLFQIDHEDPNKRKRSQQKQKRIFESQFDMEEEMPEKTPENNEFKFKAEYYDAKAQSVQIAGEFTGWQQNMIELRKDNNNEGKWEIDIIIPFEQNKDSWQFKFVVNGTDWKLSDQYDKKDDGGNVNNVVYLTKPSHQQNPLSQHSSIKQTFPDIRYARRKLNEIHDECTQNNAEIFMHQQSDDVIVVFRQFALDYDDKFDAYVSITRHCFFNQGTDQNYKTEIILPGLISEVVFAGYLDIPHQSYQKNNQDNNFISGIEAQFHIYKDLSQFCNIQESADGQKNILSFYKMPLSFTCILKTRSPNHIKQIVKEFNDFKEQSTDIISQIFSELPLSVINHLLFRCVNEEKDISNQSRGPYGLSNYGQFVYSGLASYMHILRQIKISRDMGHELFNNIRSGDWYIEYAVDRLKFNQDNLQQVIMIFEEFIPKIQQLNPTFKPKYVSRIIEKIYNACIYQLINYRMFDDFIRNTKDIFQQKLAITIPQVYGQVISAYFDGQKDTLSAGLPHFSTGYTRCWGRDTFISLRGLFIATGLKQEAKDTIIYFAKVMRHGLIPNLHDQGKNTRFNARDATWFFLQAIKDYIQVVDDGIEILQEEIELYFRDDNQEVHKSKQHEPRRKITIANLIQEIVQAHAKGIHFREWNAGTAIDENMKDKGFNVDIDLDMNNGFCFGGNQFNCGTWMDKMGSSSSNKGVPATPRDGAPIELAAMQYSIISFLNELNLEGSYEYTGVQNKNGEFLEFSTWAQLMKDNFERCFWVPLSQEHDDLFDIQQNYVQRRGIYKDVYRSTDKFTDYQLRPNICIAMSYAPELFTEENAQQCLQTIEQVLMEKGCMGIKTLDPNDKNYNGDYINNDDSRGFNYHQGPEWLWPVGFFLKSNLRFKVYETKEEAINDTMKWLIPHQKHIQKDAWESLPELTNSHGKPCQDSCKAQSWSMATVLDALRDLYYKDL